MNRRGFLAALAGAAAYALDPERALWVPGKKLISIPAPRVVLPGLSVRFFASYDPVRNDMLTEVLYSFARSTRRIAQVSKRLD